MNTPAAKRYKVTYLIDEQVHFMFVMARDSWDAVFKAALNFKPDTEVSFKKVEMR